MAVLLDAILLSLHPIHSEFFVVNFQGILGSQRSHLPFHFYKRQSHRARHTEAEAQTISKLHFAKHTKYVIFSNESHTVNVVLFSFQENKKCFAVFFVRCARDDPRLIQNKVTGVICCLETWGDLRRITTNGTPFILCNIL